ncbi:efflux RND transporter periplasmic adaptor subunit [Flavisolibacter tropicus]|uniref:RND transporter n=1 Tax=Flavisolibacter tropicus TaxID=1492898 RepID=A0A172TSH7_9BACT|nr:efflux RND transporter periplasmic adaptor subunit [Flavisolibacter tropicus]ANE49942.1 RND transporter [Flavisolibacter tropicus]
MYLLRSPLVFLLLLISCKSKQEQTQPTIENITESVYASGIVKSKNQYQVFSTSNGLIKDIMVTEGDLVQKGTPIIRIENETAQLSAENARLAADYTSVSANADKLQELRINIDLTKSKLNNDSLLMVRQHNLWAQGIGSRNELDQRDLVYQNSKTAYEAAVLRYRDLQRQVSFSAQQSQKNLQISNKLASDFTIKSETNGKVYNILKEKGEMVNMQTPIAIIGDATSFLLELQVDEYDIAQIRLGQKVLVTMDSYKGKTFEASISKINPIMNERSRSFTVEATFITAPPSLYPNLTVESNVLIQTKANALTIPRSFLINDSFVMLANKEKIKVTTGLKDYKKVEILKGLAASDFIIKPVK